MQSSSFVTSQKPMRWNRRCCLYLLLDCRGGSGDHLGVLVHKLFRSMYLPSQVFLSCNRYFEVLVAVWPMTLLAALLALPQLHMTQINRQTGGREQTTLMSFLGDGSGSRGASAGSRLKFGILDGLAKAPDASRRH